jgi:aryl-alcohol dehydrogenase-like predicted oxidoreductase
MADNDPGRRSETLPVQRLGRSDLWLTRVGLGTWAMGGLGAKMTWGAADDEDSIATIRTAIEAGINWIDTAAMYGLGHAEEVVAAALADYAQEDRPYIATKGGLRWDLADRTLRVGSPASLTWELDESLRRLEVDHVDIYYMHWPAQDGTALEEYWGAFCKMRQSGKARAIGLSNHDVSQLAAAEAVAHVDSLQPPFSAITREALGDLIPWCRENQTGVVNYAPMQSGLLTGSFSEQRVADLPSDDWRKTHDNFTGEHLHQNVGLAQSLKPIAAKHSATVGAVAVAWTLSIPGVTSAIVGARRPQQLDTLKTAAVLQLDSEDLADIARAIETTGAGHGPIPAV